MLRNRLTVLALLPGLAPLAACDSGGPVDPPAACREITNHVDSIHVEVGAVATLDLNALFTGAGTSLLYSADWDATQGAPIAQVEIDGAELSVTGLRNGVRDLFLDARASCGVVARARVNVSVGTLPPPGPNCDVIPVAQPPDAVRLAMGGVAEDLALFGENGLFRGLFGGAPVTIEVDGPVTVETVGSGSARELRLTPLSPAGTGVVRVSATDVCGRSVAVDVPFEVIDSPTCTVEYDPSSGDYLPLALGYRWRYAVERWSCPGPTCSPHTTGEEHWEVVAEGPCSMGQRTYDVSVVGTAGYTGMAFIDVRGNEARVRRPTDATLADWPWLQRLYPSTSPDSVSATNIECTPPGPGNGGDYCRALSYSLARDVGITRLAYEYSGFMVDVGIRLALIEEPFASRRRR